MACGPAACRPFAGASRAPLLAAWRRVYGEKEVREACGWDAAARDLPEDFVRGQLPFVQAAVTRAVADREGVLFLGACDLGTEAGKKDAARIRSVACGPASAWLDATPCTRQTQLSSSDYLHAARHRLGLHMPLMAAAPPCRCANASSARGDGAAPDHAQTCSATAGCRDLRHNIWVAAWRRVLQRAGCASCREPRYREIAAAGRSATAGYRRGDILAIMPDGRLVALDGVVTHAWAPSNVDQACHINGHAAARKTNAKRAAFASLREGAGGYDFVPLAAESGGRIDAEALTFLKSLGDVATLSNGRLSKSAFIRSALAELSCALCRGNGRTYAASATRLLGHAGRDVSEGAVTASESEDDAG